MTDRREAQRPEPAGQRTGRGRRASGLRTLPGDLSGAFADLGTFVPLVLGVIALGGLDPVGVFVSFGLFALATAAIYRRPVPVQPMKVVAAVAIATGLSGNAIVVSGVIVAVIMVALVLLGGVERLSRVVPQSVMAGLQLGIGLLLAWHGLRLIGSEYLPGLAALVLIAGLLLTPVRPYAAIVALILATGLAIANGTAVAPELAVGFHLPSVSIPAFEAFNGGVVDIAVGQVALTLANAVLATAALSARYFPRDAGSITPRRLALSTGLLNLALAPLGAMPMCHGAGGLAVQYRFGARTWVAPAIFGATCLTCGLLLGPQTVVLLALVPAAVLGALLAVAGAELAVTARLLDGRPWCLVVIFVTGAACVLSNVVVGLAVGLAAELVRGAIVRRSRSA